MRKTVAVACAAIGFVAAAPAVAGAATSPPSPQSFRIDILNQTARVVAKGAIVKGRGTATATSPDSFDLSFPSGPGSLTETVTDSVGGIGRGCVERLSQTGTFTFDFSPTAQPGFHFGGDGTFTSRSITVYRRLPGGGCDTTAPPRVRRVIVQADATEIFGVG